MINLVARFFARSLVTDWLIRRAVRTPYFHITSADGSETYMERYWIFNPYPANSDGTGRRWGNWLPSIRLHRILREDRDRHMHDHPWNARTFILRGWYWEVREASDCAWCSTHGWLRQPGQTVTLRHGEYHRITAVSPGGVWTLFITWRKRGTWGFLVDGCKVPWREYLNIKKDGA